MNTVRLYCQIIALIGSVLLYSCATTPEPSTIIPASQLPADVTMNRDAGRGGVLFVTLRLESGEELPFVIDTGAGGTLLDKSLESKLGKRLGTVTMAHWGTTEEANSYAAPKLYLGGARLMSGNRITTTDFQELSTHTGVRIMGLLGYDVLKHYCIQLDFAANKVRFLDDQHADKLAWGKPFPIRPLNARDWRPSICENLFGAQGPHSLIDSGCVSDGWLMPKYFRQWTNSAAVLAKGEIHSPDGMLGGEMYPQVSLGEIDVESDGIGLPFLARHLVTQDFPKKTLYLKRTSVGPLAGVGAWAALDFLRGLKDNGQLPGWSKDDHGALRSYPEVSPDSVTFNIQKNGDSSIYHDTVTRASKDSPWKLQKAWRTDQSGQTIEEYPVP